MRKQNWIINRLGDGFYASRYGTVPRSHNAAAYAPLMAITEVKRDSKGKAIRQNECSLCGWATPARRYAAGNLGRRKQAWSNHLESAHGPVNTVRVVDALRTW